ncbi:protein FAM107B isoform X2 [Xyrauchen texanus]|uniref:protein FAM107B isoform X2 n=1 Tax=Xyrauchen texanus TaxID=154827 RepID=UPI0022418BB5|nr:protein FAM107B isoform X2 [Xyrauchen texanus]
MLLYYRTQVTEMKSSERNLLMVYKNHKTESSSCGTSASQQKTEGQDHLVRPKKLPNPVLESHNHRGLHRELLFSHRWGLLPKEKPELQRFLEQRRLEQHREREQALKPPSDLEQELRKRRQKLMEYEQEEVRRREDLEKMPEFVRMRKNLRHISTSGC